MTYPPSGGSPDPAQSQPPWAPTVDPTRALPSEPAPGDGQPHHPGTFTQQGQPLTGAFGQPYGGAPGAYPQPETQGAPGGYGMGAEQGHGQTPYATPSPAYGTSSEQGHGQTPYAAPTGYETGRELGHGQTPYAAPAGYGTANEQRQTPHATRTGFGTGGEQPYGQTPYPAPTGYGTGGEQPYGQTPYGAPPQYGPPMYAPVATTNTLAILALVFAFVFPVAGIVMGHIAKRQIRESGEEGAGLATAGLAVGYAFTAIGLLLCLGYGILIAVAVNSTNDPVGTTGTF
jgi:Domain of unknown function (DUF4190)